MTPEGEARELIDAQLRRADWHVCDRKDIDLVNNQGSAVREVIMKEGHGRVDYLLFVGQRVVGVIEAKPVGTTLVGVEWQSKKYAEGLPDEFRANAVLSRTQLPFVYEASGSETHFTNGFDPYPRARNVFNFQTPATLGKWIRDWEKNPDAPTWRAKVLDMPSYEHYDLRPASRAAVGAIEESLAGGRFSRSLVQMATGAGKTRMAVTEVYRLLQYGGFNRILFLVDRNNLGDQALREFSDYTTPYDGRKFTELYNVNKLTSAGLAASSKVVISTIQRVWMGLKGEEIGDDDDRQLDWFMPDAPVAAVYSPLLPPETFDLIIVDECHRSIYGLWRGVLEYFDAHIVGLTATPTKQTIGFFQQNLVSEYSYPQSVADGVNVDFDVFRIQTKISEHGATIEAGTVVPRMNLKTHERFIDELDDDFTYEKNDLDKAVTSKSQIRLVLETFRDRLFHDIFPGRRVVPKTLIFAKDDNHAEEIVTTAREVFGRGNDFAAKITYKSSEDPRSLLQKFRNSPELRIAVTVDMIATGTDVRPIECVFFMRDVRSRTYFEQMKGRGARTINDADFQSVTQDALYKERFVIVDAIGVTEHDYVDATPLERDRAISLETLLERAATFTITPDEATTLGARLSRLDRSLTPAERLEIFDLAGVELKEITRELVSIGDSDVLAELLENGPRDESGEPDFAQILREQIREAITPLAGNARLRQRLIEIRSSHDRVIDEVSQDSLLKAGGEVDFDKARGVLESWKKFIEDNKDEIGLIHVLYSQPSGARVTFRELTALAERLRVPPLSSTLGTIWNAYLALDGDRVRRSPRHTATDLVSLIKYTLEQEEVLVPFSDVVEERYQTWLTGQRELGVEFNEKQVWWLDRIKDTIVQAAQFSVEDLELAPFTERGGSDGMGRDFGSQALAIIEGMNEALAA